MPNHVSNCWRITGPSAEIKEFANQWQALSEQGNSFDAFFPMPSELKEIRSGHIKIDGQAYNNWIEKTGPNGLKVNEPLTDQQIKEYLKRFGSVDWYEWATTNWGTKWGAYDCQIPIYGKEENGTITVDLYFDSAWSPPVKALRELSRQSPHWNIEHAYAEQGSDFIGICTVTDGQIVSDSSEDLSKFRSDNPPEEATEDEIEQFWDDWHYKDISEKFTGFAGEIFSRFPFLHEGG